MRLVNGEGRRGRLDASTTSRGLEFDGRLDLDTATRVLLNLWALAVVFLTGIHVRSLLAAGPIGLMEGNAAFDQQRTFVLNWGATWTLVSAVALWLA